MIFISFHTLKQQIMCLIIHTIQACVGSLLLLLFVGGGGCLSLFCCAVFSVLSSFAIILPGKREPGCCALIVFFDVMWHVWIQKVLSEGVQL